MSDYAKTLRAEANFTDLAKTAPTETARNFWYRKALDTRS